MVQLVCSSSCPIGTVYCVKSGKKLPVFLGEKKKLWRFYKGFQYFGDISSVLTPILARKLSVWREKCTLQDGPKFNMIKRSAKKIQLFDHTRCTHNFRKKRITWSRNSVTNNQLVFDLYICEYNPLYEFLQWKSTINSSDSISKKRYDSKGLWSLILNRALMSSSWMNIWTCLIWYEGRRLNLELD